jgi:hypothetical protein
MPVDILPRKKRPSEDTEDDALDSDEERIPSIPDQIRACLEEASEELTRHAKKQAVSSASTLIDYDCDCCCLCVFRN